MASIFDLDLNNDEFRELVHWILDLDREEYGPENYYHVDEHGNTVDWHGNVIDEDGDS